MKSVVSPLTAVGPVVLSACQDLTQPRSQVSSLSQQGGMAAGRYIVVFQDRVADVTGAARGLAAAHGSAPDFVYQRALHGFAAVLAPEAVAALRQDPRVRYVEADQPVNARGPAVDP